MFPYFVFKTHIKNALVVIGLVQQGHVYREPAAMSHHYKATKGCLLLRGILKIFLKLDGSCIIQYSYESKYLSIVIC